ncbi:MAG: hypothetical protein BWY30_00011 [Tenericutes bacterium ADurb.Bin239]|jgi:hypothetical protein|nr:MAG: hypothetical protein BWY30_00011 [Tenericutes bacterium ADurb.Bin239]HOM32277.1 hypothetical protein [Bacilli bacterium]
MNIKVVYPAKNIRRDLRRNAIYWAKFPFLLAAFVCGLVNILVGGPAWSVIAIWSLWMIWSFVFTPTLVEHNRTSIAVKTSIHITILIVIIYLIFPKWPGIEVASLVVVAGLITTATLFFSNIARQKQNFFPLLIFVVISIVFSAVALYLRKGRPLEWAMIVSISVALAIFLSTAIILRINFFREFKKRFML